MNHTFGASRLLKTAWIVLFVGGAWLCLVVRNQNDAWWLYVFLAGFLLFMYHCFWPHPIRFDDDGISQRNWWGKMKHIDWDDVSSFGHAAEGKTIVGGGEVEIVHTSHHQEKELFCRLIEQRRTSFTLGRAEVIGSSNRK